MSAKIDSPLPLITYAKKILAISQLDFILSDFFYASTINAYLSLRKRFNLCHKLNHKKNECCRIFTAEYQGPV